MKLHEAMAYAIDKEGEEIICHSLFVNYLADLQAYDTPAVKRIVDTFVSGGYGAKLLSKQQVFDYDLQVADTTSQMVRYEGYQQDLVQYVLKCLSFALGKSTEQPELPITQAQSTPLQKKRCITKMAESQLDFVKTAKGYKIELNGEIYILNEDQYCAIKRKANIPTDRLGVWLKSYKEQNI